MGRAVMGRREVPAGEIQGSLKAVLRKAAPCEIMKSTQFKDLEKEALIKCRKLASKHQIPMKVIAAEYNFDGSRVMVYFTAENKVDFRALLKELGSSLKTRVELRQIGPRDVAKLLGGIGRCGRLLCCTTCLCKFDPITVRMARDQRVSLNPATISGVCGKLLCCLKYEHSQYVCAKSNGGRKADGPK